MPKQSTRVRSTVASKLSPIVFCILSSPLATPALAQVTSELEKITVREGLANRGIEFSAAYTIDVVANVSGGLKRGTATLDNASVDLSLDLRKLLGLSATSAYFSALSNQGDSPDAELVGSAQGFDNIEVGTQTAKIYQAWVQTDFGG